MVLDRFEELIFNELKRFCNDDDIARVIMDDYLPVIRMLNEQHDGARVQAEMLYKNFKDGVDPTTWIKHIERTRNKYGATVTTKSSASPMTIPQQKIPRGSVLFNVRDVLRAGIITEERKGRPAAGLTFRRYNIVDSSGSDNKIEQLNDKIQPQTSVGPIGGGKRSKK
ncbi:hypothetical protein LJR153_007132 [Paenibacillus sp. LjRoot153]|uniref:hypothetical protein n=1 Tax=Paenibacillus sp. LjRoot153 TaxID=3342270 RepID=UPI003ECF43D7